MSYMLEQTEWIRVDWWYANHTDKPRVLLVGDSISVGYGERVHVLLRDRFDVGRLATSKCVDNPSFFKELDYVLSEFPYEIIHFNNGLHGWTCSEENFGVMYAKAVDHIQDAMPKAKLILAASTACREKEDLSRLNAETNPRVVARNAMMQACAEERGLAFNDLYATTADNAALYCPDAVHMLDTGYDVLARQVADHILRVADTTKR